MHLETALNIDLIPHHMKSHQDNECTYDQLPWQTQLNCACDQQVALVQGMQQMHPQKRKPYQLPPRH